MSTEAAAPPYEDVVAQLRSGDLAMFNRDCARMSFPVGTAVCKFAKWTTLYDHAGIVLVRDGEPRILEANFRGVTDRPLAEVAKKSYNNSVFVRRLLADDEQHRKDIEASVERFAVAATGMHYKHAMHHFLGTAMQPPDIVEASRVADALSEAQARQAQLQALRRDAAKLPGVTGNAVQRRLAYLAQELEVLHEAHATHQARLGNFAPEFMTGYNDAGDASGFFCSEMYATAMQQCGAVATYPAASTYGTHDLASLQAYTPADEVRHRRPLRTAPDICLGPELLVAADAKADASVPVATEAQRAALVRSLEAAGLEWGEAARAAGAFDLKRVQRAEMVPLTAGRGDGTTVVPHTAPLLVSSGGAKAFHFRVPTGVASGVARARAALPSNATSVAVAETAGTVWVASDAALRAAILAPQDVDAWTPPMAEARLRPGEAVPGCEKIATAPLTLYRVVAGSTVDVSTGRISTAGDIIGLDALVQCLSSSGANGAWNGTAQHLATPAPPQPVSRKNATELQRIGFDSVLHSGVVPLPDGTTEPLHRLLTRYRIFATYCDLGAAGGAPLRMSPARHRVYFGIDAPELGMTVPRWADVLLRQRAKTTQRRSEDGALFSEVLRFELQLQRVHDATADIARTTPAAMARAAMTPIVERATPDGTMNVDLLNSVLHEVYRGSGGHFSELVPFAHHAGGAEAAKEHIAVDDFLALIGNGTITIPSFVTADIVELAHIAASPLAGPPAAYMETTHAMLAAELTSSALFGDSRCLVDTAAYRTRLWTVVACATAGTVALFPLQYVQWHRQMYGQRVSAQRWAFPRCLARSAFDMWACAAMRCLVARNATAAVLHAGLMTAASHEASHDPTAAPHRFYSTLAIGLATGIVAAAITYPLDTMAVTSLHNTGMPCGTTGSTLNSYGSRRAVKVVARELFAAHGVRGLYRGVHASLLTAVPYFGFHWIMYHDAVVPLIIDGEHAQPALSGEKLSPASWFATGSSAARWWKGGTIAMCAVAHHAVAYPAETLRRVAIVSQKPMSHVLAEQWREQPSALKFVRRFYAGAGIAAIRGVPLFVGTYALTGAALSKLLA
jgi:hypothetical protein